MSNLRIEDLEIVLERTKDNHFKVSIDGIKTDMDDELLLIMKGDTLTIKIPSVIVKDSYKTIEFKCLVKK